MPQISWANISTLPVAHQYICRSKCPTDLRSMIHQDPYSVHCNPENDLIICMVSLHWPAGVQWMNEISLMSAIHTVGVQWYPCVISVSQEVCCCMQSAQVPVNALSWWHTGYWHLSGRTCTQVTHKRGSDPSLLFSQVRYWPPNCPQQYI